MFLLSLSSLRLNLLAPSPLLDSLLFVSFSLSLFLTLPLYLIEFVGFICVVCCCWWVQLWPWVVVYRGVHPPVTNSRVSTVSGGFQTSKIDSNGLIGRFSSLKPDSLDATIKTNKIWKLQAFSGKYLVKIHQIRLNFC